MLINKKSQFKNTTLYVEKDFLFNPSTITFFTLPYVTVVGAHSNCRSLAIV